MDSRMKEISSSVEDGCRIGEEDARYLFQKGDIYTLGELASHVNEQKNGKNAYFIINRHINPTNICVNRCKF